MKRIKLIFSLKLKLELESASVEGPRAELAPLAGEMPVLSLVKSFQQCLQIC